MSKKATAAAMTLEEAEAYRTYLVIEKIERYLHNCPKCGTTLEGRVVMFKPEHKSCGACMMFAVNWLVGNLGLPDKYIV